jgi:DNA (cytosine-5)-methyltransferase 1
MTADICIYKRKAAGKHPDMFPVLDLFSGIGGFSLGLERTGGFRTAAFCEIDPYARRVLARHWPEAPCYHDVRTLTADRLAADGISVDVICGGFPCQDISLAGAGAGLAGERSGLWREFARLIGELRPRFVIVENVAALLARGLGDVLGDLAALGYDAEWHCIPASAVGAPHRRDRIWIVAYPDRDVGHERGVGNATQGPGRWNADRSGIGPDVADADSQRELQSEGRVCDFGRRIGDGRADDACANGHSRPELATIERTDWWAVEPDVGRVANGIPSRVDRLQCLGNAIVPQIAEMIGRAILEAAA